MRPPCRGLPQVLKLYVFSANQVRTGRTSTGFVLVGVDFTDDIVSSADVLWQVEDMCLHVVRRSQRWQPCTVIPLAATRPELWDLLRQNCPDLLLSGNIDQSKSIRL